MNSKSRNIISAAFAAAFFAFWMWGFPQGLNYQEQNQLFLWTSEYLVGSLSVSGGLADWLSEFLVQFFRVRWLGAAILALLLSALQIAIWNVGDRKDGLFGISFVPSLLILVYMGNMDVLVSFPVALLLAVVLCRPFAKAGLHKLWAAPLAFWLIGPVVILPVLYSLAVKRSLRELLLCAYYLLAVFLIYKLLLMQYTPRDVMFGINYFRIVETLPALQVIIPATALACILLIKYCGSPKCQNIVEAGLLLTLVAGCAFGISKSYDKDSWELLAYDMMERDGRYADILSRAEKYQPKNSISATYVNLALVMEGRTDELWRFYQCGVQGLVMPSIRDNLSDIASCDILWMCAMNNISLQYAFDLQESIQNGRKSGRFTSRIAECHIVNGHYDIALRYLSKLTHTTFYKKWAEERINMINGGNAGVDSDPVYAYLRRARSERDYITNYEALDAMLILLYQQENTNAAAAIYARLWQEMKKVQKFHDEETDDTGVHGS